MTSKFDSVCFSFLQPSISSDYGLAKVSGLTQLVHEKGISMCLSTGGVEKRNIKITEVIDNGRRSFNTHIIRLLTLK